MVLELHIWGPAFSLPSIDAQCLATIAYLVKTVPQDRWVLVASSDPSVSPTSTFSTVYFLTVLEFYFLLCRKMVYGGPDKR